MKFNDEIKKISEKILPCEIYLSSRGGYFTGVKRILTFTSEEISVLNANGIIKIFGVNLSVSKLVDGDLGFVGKIVKVEWEYR